MDRNAELARRESSELSLPVKILFQEGALGIEDTIYLLLHQAHFYVILNTLERTVRYITDGLNQYITDEDARASIQERWGFTAIGVKAPVQRKVDYCASSAVLIAKRLDFFYRNGTTPSEIFFTKESRGRVVKELHPEHSEV